MEKTRTEHGNQKKSITEKKINCRNNPGPLPKYFNLWFFFFGGQWGLTRELLWQQATFRPAHCPRRQARFPTLGIAPAEQRLAFSGEQPHRGSNGWKHHRSPGVSLEFRVAWFWNPAIAAKIQQLHPNLAIEEGPPCTHGDQNLFPQILIVWEDKCPFC